MPPNKISPKTPPNNEPLGKTFAAKLKAATPGKADHAVVMETLRSVPVEQLKAALSKGTPKERRLIFSAIPANQLKSVVGSLPVSVLAPSEPAAPAPLPAPTGGPPASILRTTYINDPYLPA